MTELAIAAVYRLETVLKTNGSSWGKSILDVDSREGSRVDNGQAL